MTACHSLTGLELYMNVRAKFKCESATKYQYGSRQFKFLAVCADEVEENKRFHKATPSGELSIYVDNPAVDFVPGKHYYLDFSEAE
jgi:hypothetical protein